MLIPEDNIETIDQIIKEAGLDPSYSPPQNAMLLASYYQANIPYTYRPGYTPRDKDFVNYFLTENRRGYCSHFASAAVLIFRRLGILTRYVEGYVVDATDIVEDGKILENLNPDDYYSGYKPLDETAVVEVDVTDAGAHAWLEMWIEGIGWQIVDITPASSEQADDSIWRMFMNFFNGNNPQTTVEETADTDMEAADPGRGSRAFIVMFEVMIVILAVCFMAYIIYRYGVAVVKRRNIIRKSVNDRVVYRYGRYITKMSRKITDLSECINYEEQTDVFVRAGVLDEASARKLCETLEQAGFSDRDISKEDEAFVYSVLKSKKK